MNDDKLPKRGRPPTGNVAVHLRLSADVLEALDAYRGVRGLVGNRQEAVRKLLGQQLVLLGYLPPLIDWTSPPEH